MRDITRDLSARKGFLVLGVLTISVFMSFTFVGAIAQAASYGSLQVTNAVKGGSATISNFSITLQKVGSGNSSSISGTAQTITFSSLVPGEYKITVSGPSGYKPVFSGNCNAHGSVTIAANTQAKCTITNTFGSSSTGGTGGGNGGNNSGGSSGNDRSRPTRPGR